MPNEWPPSVPGPRPRKAKKAKQPKQKSGNAGGGTTVGMALVFGLPALAFFGTLGYCVYMKVAA